MTVDPRERLRQYLEQRRELGESELVLDRLSVDEVMRLLGAAGTAGAGASIGATAPRAAGVPADLPAPPPVASGEPDDYGAPADHPRLSATEPASTSAPSAGEPAPTVDVPPAVGEAHDADGPTDWREALRAAGGAPDQVARGRASPPGGDVESRPPVRPPADEGEPAGAGMAPSSAPGAAAVPDPRVDRVDEVSQREVATGGGAAGWLGDVGVPVGLVVGESMGQLFGGPFDHLDGIDAIAETVRKCTRCPLYKTATHGVPGEGNPEADFVVVGEAPGADEDASGRPFVGASGQLLTKILGAINLRREDVFICNVVKHRPPGNRNPAPDEVEACSPYLVRQLELLRPRVILTLGNFAAQTLLATKLGITKLRGQVHLYYGIPLVPTYHPAALLRNQAWKRPTWEDVQLARRILDRAREG